MKILFFTEISPFPINGGERIRSYGLIKSLAVIGHKVIAAIKNRDSVNLSDYKIEGVKFVEYIGCCESVVRRALLLNYFLPQQSVIDFLKRIMEEEKPNLIFIDYDFLGHYIRFFKRFDIPIIYGTHNSQSQLTLQQPTTGFMKFIRKYQRAAMEVVHERVFFGKADALVVVSEEDRRFHSRFVKRERIFVIPNFLDEDRYTIAENDVRGEPSLVMTANFNAYMNFEGVKWFLSEVWNDDLDKKWKLRFVGKGSEFLVQRVALAKRFKNIECLGPVDDVLPYLRKASALVIPLLHGSGSRLKCLEAMALKIPVVSTLKGVEGINSNGFVVASTADEFRQVLNNNEFTEKADVNQARCDFLKGYSLKSTSAVISRMLDSIML